MDDDIESGLDEDDLVDDGEAHFDHAPDRVRVVPQNKGATFWQCTKNGLFSLLQLRNKKYKCKGSTE